MGCDLPPIRHRWETSCNFNPRTPCGVRPVRSSRYATLSSISIHAPRVGCDLVQDYVATSPWIFQSTHPVWGATQGPIGPQGPKGEFQSTHPVWGATVINQEAVEIALFQSTHPVWGATRGARRELPLESFQSTHPVWGATPAQLHPWVRLSISIHAPRVGCDDDYRSPRKFKLGFQSTHPVWGATLHRGNLAIGKGISIHAPRVGCDVCPMVQEQVAQISIHAPRVGCDTPQTQCDPGCRHFNPRTPCGVRLRTCTSRLVSQEISIHAPRVGCDWVGVALPTLHGISIHAPRVGCDGKKPEESAQPAPISIHAPRVGCDAAPLTITQAVTGNFNPRTPCGVRLNWPHRHFTVEGFQSTHPVWGATLGHALDVAGPLVFQSTHPVWGATEAQQLTAVVPTISIHAPRVGCDTGCESLF